MASTLNGSGKKASHTPAAVSEPPAAKKPSRFAAAKNTGTIVIPKIDVQVIRIKLVGDSSLVMHAWSEKAKAMMLGKQMKLATPAKEAKDPFRDYCDSMHWITPKPPSPTEADVAKAKFGFPVIGFKGAAVDACSFVDGVTKVMARGAFHINGDLVEIKTPEPPVMREDTVRIAMGTADIRHRGEFRDWSCELSVRFNARVMSPEQIVNLFNTAGFAIGIGEHRPACNGQWGMFHCE